MRGTVTRTGKTFVCHRITPACAGNRRWVHQQDPHPEDHPRVCGEQHPLSPNPHIIFGSPPRVRGTAWGARGALVGRGITPACAGNRSYGDILVIGVWDHPRVCGEQYSLGIFYIDSKGSPPRVRGTERLLRFKPLTPRITPACAGNSFYSIMYSLQQKDHPRVCGEQFPGSIRKRSGKGSPPRVRGTACSPCGPCGPSRITPACAGNSSPPGQIVNNS